METEVTVNLTVEPDTQHPCYGRDQFDKTVIYTPSAMCILLCIFLAFLSVTAICGNLLVIISIIYFKQLHTPTNYLIVSLAVADLLIGTIVCPLNIIFPHKKCMYDWSALCHLKICFENSLTTCSILNLGCISIDRYYAVCHPLTYRTKISHHVVVIMILVSWGFTAVTFDTKAFSSLESCIQSCKIVLFILLTLLLYLPLIIMTCIFCIYLKIFIVAQRQVRSIQNTTCQSTKSGATVSKMERKATKTLTIVLGVYLLCWFPFFLNNFVVTITLDVSLTPDHVLEILVWFKLLNSMLNPFIYAFFYTWFRSAFRMIISGKIFQGDFTNSQLH